MSVFRNTLIKDGAVPGQRSWEVSHLLLIFCLTKNDLCTHEDIKIISCSLFFKNIVVKMENIWSSLPPDCGFPAGWRSPVWTGPDWPGSAGPRAQSWRSHEGLSTWEELTSDAQAHALTEENMWQCGDNWAKRERSFTCTLTCSVAVLGSVDVLTQLVAAGR